MATPVERISRAQWRHICRIVDASGKKHYVGTVVLVSDKGTQFGYALTCRHNLGKKNRLRVSNEEVQLKDVWLIPDWDDVNKLAFRRPATVVGLWSSEKQDVAVLKLPRSVIDDFGLGPISVTFDLRQGMTLSVIGFQRPGELMDSDGVSVTVVATSKRIWNGLRAFEVATTDQIPWSTGMSGGAMFDRGGALVGLAQAVAPDEMHSHRYMGYGIPMSTVASSWTTMGDHCHVVRSPAEEEEIIRRLRERLLLAVTVRDVTYILHELDAYLHDVPHSVPAKDLRLEVLKAIQHAESLKGLGERLLLATTDRELKSILHELDAYLHDFPNSVPAKDLRSEVERLLQDAKSNARRRLLTRRAGAAAALTLLLLLAIVLYQRRQGGSTTPPDTGNTPSQVGKPTGQESTFDVQRLYRPSGQMGDIGDLTMSPGGGAGGADRFTYVTQGNGPHEFEYKYKGNELSPAPARFAGVMYLSPANCWGDRHDCGYDLRGFRRIRWEARSLNGEATVEFVVGTDNWRWDNKNGQWERANVPFPGTVPSQTLRVETLTSEWKPLEKEFPPELNFSRVVGGFGWVMNWGSNGVEPGEGGKGAKEAKTFVIEIQNVRYER